MGRFLPGMRHAPRIRRVTQTVFGGIDHREGTADGQIYDMTNLSGINYPVLSPREPRMIIRKLENPHGIYARDGLIWVDGSELWRMAEAATEYDAFSGSGTVKSDGSAILDVDTGETFKELLRIADRQEEASGARLNITYTEAGAPMSGIVEVTDFELSADRRTVYLANSTAGVVLESTSTVCRLRSTASVGAEIGDRVTVTFTLTFPRVMPVNVGTVSPLDKKWSALNTKVVFFPDKMYLDTATGELGSLEAMWSGEASIGDGTYGDSPAVLNTITATVNPFPFNEGDAVTVSVTETDGRVNNGTFIIRGVSEDKLTLTFLENTFKTAVEDSHLRLTRTVPDLDYICECGGRLWGCKGDEIFASKLGDVFNWNSFDGISTDSWSVSVPSPGEFTGCVAYLGMPTLFEENMIYKVYGTYPEEFRLIDSATLGCDAESGASLAVTGETLFYISKGAVAAYTGSVQQVASAVLGNERLSCGVAGSDGVRYYLSCRDGDRLSLYVYDTGNNLWHREDSTEAMGFAFEGDNLYMLSRDGVISAVRYGGGLPADATEELVISEAIFAPYTASGDTDKKGIGRVTLRCEITDAAQDMIEVYIRYGGMAYDSRDEGRWESLGLIAPLSRNSFNLTFVPRRCDSFALKIVGRGRWRVHAISREYYVSSSYR